MRIQAIDKIAIALIMTLSCLIGFVVWGTNACGSNCPFQVKPQVTQFSWQDKKIGSEDRAFLLTFNRPMDRDSIEANLVIEPPLPGKISWSGNKLAYTLNAPAPYGENYRLFIEDGQQQFTGGKQSGEKIQPFFGKFHSRDRAFAYIGNQGKEQGRLILYNWTQQEKTILTPPDLIVFDFEPYHQSDRILFSAANKQDGIDGIRKLQLYTVTTQLNQESPTESSAAIELVLDNQKYQNNKFDLSQDGQTIIVQRINRQKPADFGLWKITANNPPQRLPKSQGGDFLLTPDSQTLAVAQGEGIALLPLTPNDQPLDFLPKFGKVVSFSPDGTAAAMINYNTDNAELRYTSSLFYVNNQGIEKELINLEGSIIDCQFNPNATHLYCLLTELRSEPEFYEQPYLAEINLKTTEIIPLLALPQYQDSKISVAPDGLGVLFDQVLTTNEELTEKPSGNGSSDVINSRMWLLIPPTDQTSIHQVEQLPLVGFHPQWLP
ncbi:MAG: Ig-like domain-containing protein [Xenococcus sp. MO_188.B8]|nr:Ig-like domain-containing protein [Xenococcus sp. MO_188.B8]